MAETLKKAATAAKEGADKLSAAVASARTRSGEPKVTKAPKKAPAAEPTPEPVDTGKRLDAFIAHEKGLLALVDIPDDTGDAMYNAVQAVLYYKERITNAELAKNYLAEG